MEQPATKTALVIGSGGGLGGAVVDRLLEQNSDRVFAISRCSNKISDERVHWRQCDYSEEAIDRICAELKDSAYPISTVTICNGTLHGPNYYPEKRIESLEPESMLEVYKINAVIPMMWVKSLLPVLAGKHNCVLSVFSARVGSINDNRLGGWYSYRASKAALNMLLKTASIEYARRAANVKLIAFHPGTTDTPLSKPFQDSVPDNKLFTPDFVAVQLLEVMERANPTSGLEFIDWNGKPIQW
jgi:NAD(P)-dependent dehydrogenase (short-subunit alcohol dehydrogenase family)